MLNILTVWFILTQTLPPFNLIMPVTGALQVAFFVGGFMILYPGLLMKRSIICLIVYGVVTFAAHLLGNAYFSTINDVVVPFLYMLSGLLLAEYSFRFDSKYELAKIVVIIVITTNVIMSALSIPQLIIYPNLMRNAYELQGEELESVSFLMGYGNLHGLPLLFAPLVFICRKSFRSSKIKFLLWLAVIAVLFGVVFFSNGAMALFISLISAILPICFRFEKITPKIVSRITVFGVVAVVLMQPPILVPIIRTFQSLMDPNSLNYEKMNEIEDSVMYGESGGDLGSRQELYESSSKLFIESPIWGTSTPELIGRHSWVMDRLALFGILFVIPLVLMFFHYIKTVYNHLIYSRVIFVFGLICWLMMLYLKAEFGAGTWLYGFAFLPIFCRYADYLMESQKL